MQAWQIQEAPQSSNSGEYKIISRRIKIFPLEVQEKLLFSGDKQVHVSVCTHVRPPYTLSHLQPSPGVKLWLLTDTSGKEIPHGAGISP